MIIMIQRSDYPKNLGTIGLLMHSVSVRYVYSCVCSEHVNADNGVLPNVCFCNSSVSIFKNALSL